jgi:hypothetical protein
MVPRNHCATSSKTEIWGATYIPIYINEARRKKLPLTRFILTKIITKIWKIMSSVFATLALISSLIQDAQLNLEVTESLK